MASLHAIRFYIFTFYSLTFQSAYFDFFCCPKILCRGKKDKWKFLFSLIHTQGAVIGIMSVCPWHSFLFLPLLLLLPSLTFDSKDFSRIVAAARVILSLWNNIYLKIARFITA